MEYRIVGEDTVGAEPDMLLGGRLTSTAGRVAVDVPEIDRRGRWYQSPICSAYGAIRVWKSGSSMGSPMPSGIGC